MHMMKFIIVLFVLTISTESNLFAQDLKDEEIKKFLVSVGEMQEEDRCSYYAYELLDSDTIKSSDSCGIYRIGVHGSHSYTYLLLLDKQKKTFLDCHTNLYQTLSSAFSFFDNCSCQFTDSEKLSYIRKIMDIYNRNETAVPW
jgi:hypothetical protein